jgi:hypothetical protein
MTTLRRDLRRDLHRYLRLGRGAAAAKAAKLAGSPGGLGTCTFFGFLVSLLLFLLLLMGLLLLKGWGCIMRPVLSPLRI